MNRLIKYEIFRIRKSRSTKIVFLLYLLGALGFAFAGRDGVFASAESFHTYIKILCGMILILPGIIVAQSITQEHSGDAIKNTLVLFPKRTQLLFGKWIVSVSVASLIVLIALCCQLGLAILFNGIWSDTVQVIIQASRVLISCVAILTFIFGIALLVRQTFLAVILPVAILSIIEGLIEVTLKLKSSYLPATALSTFTGATHGGWNYLAIYLGFVAFILIIGIWKFKRQDY